MSQQTTKATETTETPKTENDLYKDVNVNMKSGHLTKDAQITKSGNYVRMRVATNKEYFDTNGEVQKTTNYFNVMVSKHLTDSFEIAKSLEKGNWVYVKGEDQSKSIDTPEGYKETGSTLFAWKVVKKKEKDQSTNAPEAFDQAQELSQVPS